MEKLMTVQPDFAAENKVFERQAAASGRDIRKLPGGFYADPITQACWSFWIARASIAVNGFELRKEGV